MTGADLITVRMPKGESRRIPILRTVVLYGIPGFAIHRHVILPEEFTVSHIETGLEVASGSTAVLALRAVRQIIRRQKLRWNEVSGKRILERGIQEGRK
jgi:hypothetical protein